MGVTILGRDLWQRALKQMFSHCRRETLQRTKVPSLPQLHVSLKSQVMNGDFRSTNIIHPESKVSRKKTKSPHLFRLTAGGSQQERIQHVFPSQEEAVAVLIQVDGGQGELAVMAAEDGRAVGGEQICE